MTALGTKCNFNRVCENVDTREESLARGIAEFYFFSHVEYSCLDRGCSWKTRAHSS